MQVLVGKKEFLPEPQEMHQTCIYLAV